MRISDWSSDVCSSDLPVQTEFSQQKQVFVFVIAADSRSALILGAGVKPNEFYDPFACCPGIEGRLPTWLRRTSAVRRHAGDVLMDCFLLPFYADRKSTRLNSSH